MQKGKILSVCDVSHTESPLKQKMLSGGLQSSRSVSFGPPGFIYGSGICTSLPVSSCRHEDGHRTFAENLHAAMMPRRWIRFRE